MGDKPSYLGLLNAIAIAESDAECLLQAWADVSPNDEVRDLLRFVALREGEHGKAFAKRISELGFAVRPKVAADSEKRMKVAVSTRLTDRQKFEKLGFGRDEDTDGPDVFTGMFADTTIDIQTGALHGRYNAEERDTGRRLRACYASLVATDECEPVGAVETVDDRLDRIERMLEKLVAERS
jgi:hypothetical protein